MEYIEKKQLNALYDEDAVTMKGWAMIKQMPTIDIVDGVERRPIRGYEGMYAIDAVGNVYSLRRVKTVNDNGRIYDKPIKGMKLKPWLSTTGYWAVALTKDGKTKQKYVHRLVADAFIPNPDGLPCVNHKDEDKTNNSICNLEWCTVLYNNTYGTKIARRREKVLGVKHTREHNQKIAESNKLHWAKKRQMAATEKGEQNEQIY